MNRKTPPCGTGESATAQAIRRKTAVSTRPTRTSSRSGAAGRRWRLYRSIVAIVEAELSTDASVLMTAPARAAKMKPRRPVGTSSRTSTG